MTQSMIAHTTYSKTERIKLIYMLAARTLNTEIMRSIIILTNGAWACLSTWYLFYDSLLICKVTEVKIYVNSANTIKFWLTVMHTYITWSLNIPGLSCNYNLFYNASNVIRSGAHSRAVVQALFDQLNEVMFFTYLLLQLVNVYLTPFNFSESTEVTIVITKCCWKQVTREHLCGSEEG